jgi:hypothetical protein
MRSPKELTRAEIVRAADNFRWTRKGAKWTVIVGERELPARPLVLEAAGVPPNDPTNSHQAVEILRRLGFETRYARERAEMRANEKVESLEPGDGLDSILEIASAATKEVPEDEWERVPANQSNVSSRRPEPAGDWLERTAGGWAGLVDAEELKREVYKSRSVTTRTEPRL